MPDTRDIVRKIWNSCNVLRDDGITYLQYPTELTYLLFLKMTKETGKEDQIPKRYRDRRRTGYRLRAFVANNMPTRAYR